MPWVNTIAADRDGDVLYADHSVIPNVTNELGAEVHDRRRPADLRRRPACPASTAPGPTTTCTWGTDKDAQRPGILGPEAPARDVSAATG